jgi:hypothetical protein
MNTKNALVKYLTAHRGAPEGNGDDGSNTFETSGRIGSKVGNVSVKSMKNILQMCEDSRNINSIDQKWYLKNRQEIPIPPQAWYDFAKDEFPGVATTISQDAGDITDDPTDQEETDNVQDDIQEVTDKKVGPSTFTGTWNNTKGHPVSGQMTIPHPDGVTIANGTWTYDTNSNKYWFSQGTKKYPDGSYGKGTFDASKFLDGEYYEIDVPRTDPDLGRVYATITGYKQGGKIDTTKQFKISRFDASTKKEVVYYEGTVDENVKPNNGTAFEDSTKTTELGKYTNGEWTAK